MNESGSAMRNDSAPEQQQFARKRINPTWREEENCLEIFPVRLELECHATPLIPDT